MKDKIIFFEKVKIKANLLIIYKLVINHQVCLYYITKQNIYNIKLIKKMAGFSCHLL